MGFSWFLGRRGWSLNQLFDLCSLSSNPLKINKSAGRLTQRPPLLSSKPPLRSPCLPGFS